MLVVSLAAAVSHAVVVGGFYYSGKLTSRFPASLFCAACYLMFRTPFAGRGLHGFVVAWLLGIGALFRKTSGLVYMFSGNLVGGTAAIPFFFGVVHVSVGC